MRSKITALFCGFALAISVAVLAQPGGYPSRPRFQAVGIGATPLAQNGILSIAGTAPIIQIDETDAAANERITRLRATAGLLELVSMTDALGAGNVILSANRVAAGFDVITLGGSASSVILAAGGSTQLTASTSRIDIGSRLGLADGTLASPGLQWTDDTNTGLDLAGLDAIQVALGGAQNSIFTGNQYQLNTSGNATAPSFSWIGDTDNGIYRVAADNIGITNGGALQYDFNATEFDLNDNNIEDSVDNNVNVSADMTIVGNLSVTGTFSASGTSSSYGGYTDNAAAAEHVPSGWSVSLAASTFTWTHNLGLASPFTDLAVTVTPQVGSSEACRVNAVATNSFDVICYTTSTGSAANVAHFITAVRVAD